jgi:hypothetical protein
MPVNWKRYWGNSDLPLRLEIAAVLIQNARDIEIDPRHDSGQLNHLLGRGLHGMRIRGEGAGRQRAKQYRVENEESGRRVPDAVASRPGNLDPDIDSGTCDTDEGVAEAGGGSGGLTFA